MAKKKSKPAARAASKPVKKQPAAKSPKAAGKSAAKKLIQALDDFSLDRDAQEDIDALAEEALKASPSAELMDAILRVFERFPDANEEFRYLGSALEEMPGFEKRLVSSVKRVPSLSGLRKINQLLNSDMKTVGKTDLVKLLHSIAASEKVDIGVREEAEGYLKFQGALGKDATLIRIAASTTAGKVSADDLRCLLGTKFDAAKFKQLEKKLGDKGSTSRGDGDCYLRYVKSGIEFAGGRDRIAEAVFLHLVADSSTMAFSGVLPRGLLASDSQAQVRKKLGKPTKSGGGDTFPVLGKMPFWDCYDTDNCSLHIDYVEGKSAIKRITISLIVAGKVMADDLRNLLGKKFDADEFQQLEKRLGEKASTSRIDGESYLRYVKSGISFSGGRDRKAATLFLYLVPSKSNEVFSGDLPQGLLPSDSQAKVRKKLGKPTKSGGGGEIVGLGKIPFWDCYDADNFSTQIEYVEGKSAIKRITISLLDAKK